MTRENGEGGVSGEGDGVNVMSGVSGEGEGVSGEGDC